MFASPYVASLKNDAEYDIIDKNAVPVPAKGKDASTKDRHLDWKNPKDVLMLLDAVTKEGDHIPDLGTKTKMWKAVQKNRNDLSRVRGACFGDGSGKDVGRRRKSGKRLEESIKAFSTFASSDTTPPSTPQRSVNIVVSFPRNLESQSERWEVTSPITPPWETSSYIVSLSLLPSTNTPQLRKHSMLRRLQIAFAIVLIPLSLHHAECASQVREMIIRSTYQDSSFLTFIGSALTVPTSLTRLEFVVFAITCRPELWK
jgi:hypothetical protein